MVDERDRLRARGLFLTCVFGVASIVLVTAVVFVASSRKSKLRPAEKSKAIETLKTPVADTLPGAPIGEAHWLSVYACVGIAAFLYFVFVVLLMAWVARDCRARGVDGGAVWVLIMLLFSAAGLLVYMASRPHGSLTRCPRCGNSKLMMAKRCHHCGEQDE